MSSDILDKALLQKVMCLGFTGYLTRGLGCVVVKEPADLNSPSVSEELLNYLPCGPDDRTFPEEAVELADKYDPMKEVVLAITDKKKQTLVLQLTAQQAGITPVEAYRAWSRASGMGQFVPGELLHFNGQAKGVEEGHYIFLGRRGAMMRICEAGIQDDDEITVTKAEHLVHGDFEECFTPVLGVLVEGVSK